jgi:ubiquinol-cytochrome c reductase cytochrome b subunit
VRSANFRPLYRIFLFIFFADVIALGYVGSQEPVGAIVTVSQVLTAWYFIHVLVILPLLGFFETPLKMPASITEAVLGPQGSSAAVMAARTAASPPVDG